ncbi:uncharacterized protein C9orf50 homolog [Choloepus didactylus]|uniref:uncharacterized protein C9orf50 homolog n=1 Tax=Choloepus didactylus TaxID=27675 RepID=UPI00189CC91E|nr:uncharacterized protein C9orf50 homolog [Choloepus didactylus]
MPRRHPNPEAQEVAPKWFPGDRDLRRRQSRLPKLIAPELREILQQHGARGSGGSRVPGGGGACWQDPRRGSPDPQVHRVTVPGVGVESFPRLAPATSTAARRGARNAAALRSRPLPPLLSAGAPRSLRPEERGPPQRGLDRETSCSLGALIGKFLPSKFREFLRQLGAESREQPPLTSSTSEHQGGVAENRRRSPQCPHCSFLPDLRRPYSTQAPKLKAGLTHSSSGEGSRPRRRCCPFRVRFADETLRDTALRYWERNCAVQQCLLKERAASQSTAAEQVFGSVGRWLESLPRVLHPKTRKEKATASSLGSWDCPSLPPQELQGHLSENSSMTSSLPFLPRATTQRQRRDLQTYLDAHNILKQVGKPPRSWSQKLESFLPKLVLQSVLKRGHSKGYQLLLSSTTPQQAQR